MELTPTIAICITILLGVAALFAGIKTIIETVYNMKIKYRRSSDDESSAAIFDAIMEWWNGGASGYFEETPLFIKLIENRLRREDE